MLPLHTILHPTDFSETCESAFRVATALARDYGARLILLHVMPLPDLAYGEGLIVAEEFYDHDTPREKLVLLAESAPGIEIETLLRDGDPTAEILAAARETSADLIVMATHRRRGLSRLLMGSVAEQVEREAECPVLMLKAPMHTRVRAEAHEPVAAELAAGPMFPF